MTTTSTTKSQAKQGEAQPEKNVPSHHIFTVEKTARDTIWKKVGVAFTTKNGHYRILIGEKDDEKRQVLLFCASSTHGDNDDGRGDDLRRRPCAQLFDANGTCQRV